MSRVRQRLAVLVMAGLALTLAGGTTAATSARAATPSIPAPSTTPPRVTTTAGTGPNTTSTMAITLTSLSPTVVGPTSTLTIRGTVTNTGRASIQNGTVRLLVHHSPLVSRNLVAEWGAGAIEDVGGQIEGANADLSVQLAPGASVPFTLRAEPGTLGLTMAYASIGITLEALGDDGTALGTHRLGLLRTYLTWQAKPDYVPLKVTWLMPVTGGPSSVTGSAPSASVLAAAVAPQTRLGNVLAGIQAAPTGSAVSVAIDPAFAADLETRATVTSSPGSSAGSSAARARRAARRAARRLVRRRPPAPRRTGPPRRPPARPTALRRT